MRVLKRISNSGFTVIELMIAMAIFLIMSSMVLVIVQTATTSYHSADARITSQSHLRQMMRVMFHEISETTKTRINISGTSNNVITFQIPVRVTDVASPNYNQMVDSRNKIIFGARELPVREPEGIEDYAVRYELESGSSGRLKLVRKVLDSFPSGNQVGNDYFIADNIESVRYTLDGDTVSVNVTVAKIDKFNRDNRLSGNFGIVARN